MGTWMTIGNLVGPLTLYLDRPIIGTLLSVSAVTYYSVPYEIVGKLLIISGAVVGVMFPAFSAAYSENPAQAGRLYVRWLKYLFVVLYPVCMVIFVCAAPGLELWLGKDFSSQSYLAMQILVVGFFLLGIEGIPFALIQGIGRVDLLAKLNLFELPFFALALWLLTAEYGIVGTAVAFSLRAAVNALVLFAMANHLLPESKVNWGVLRYLALSATVVAGLAWIDLATGPKVLLLMVLMAIHARIFWVYLFDSSDRLVFAPSR
jgi:O-antigen/teichoic acid export membrane protein